MAQLKKTYLIKYSPLSAMVFGMEKTVYKDFTSNLDIYFAYSVVAYTDGKDPFWIKKKNVLMAENPALTEEEEAVMLIELLRIQNDDSLLY